MPIFAAMPAERPPARAGDRGFALVEMLVAMLLLSLVGLAFTRFQTFQLTGARTTAALVAARIAADNVAVDLAVRPVLAAGPMQGTSRLLGAQVHWTATSRASAAAAIAPGLLQLNIATRLQPDGPDVAQRTLLRPARLPQPLLPSATAPQARR